MFYQSKIRILPIFIFVAVLMFTVRVNSVFDVLKGEIKSEVSVNNKAFAQEDSVKKEETLEDVLKQSLASSEASKKMETVRDVSSDSFKPVKENSDYSASELKILQSLASRREKLTKKEKNIERKLIQLEAAEKQIDAKIAKLQNYETKLKELIGKYNDGEKKKSQSLVKMYSTMKPKDAARIFNTLDMDILINMFENMKPSTASAILSKMNSERAKEITAELAGNTK